MNGSAWVPLASAAIALAACTPSPIQGNGDSKREERSVKPFYELELEGNYQLSIRCGKPSHRVWLAGESNLLARIETSSNGKRLLIKSPERLQPKTPLQVQLEVPDIKLVRTRGPHSIAVRDIDNARFQLDCQGACKAKLSGKTQKLWIYLKGGGQVDALGLPTLQALVSIQGAGQADVDVRDNLELLVTGAGLVRYRGKPHLENHLRGAARLVPIHPGSSAAPGATSASPSSPSASPSSPRANPSSPPASP